MLIKCPICGGTNLNRKGYNASGSQRYFCKDCKKKFTPDSKKPEIIDKICPNCGSKEIIKNGFVSNVYQRYECKSCGKNFTDNIINMAKEQLLDTCPHCQSKHIKKSGFLKSGVRRYLCCDCGKSFSNRTVVREKLDKICPECGSDKIVRSGYNDNGSPRYLCKSCNKRFGDNELRVYTRYDKTCPKCGNSIAVKAGKDKGRQLWICRSCNHKFSEEPKFLHISKEILDKIPILLEEGYCKTEIAGQLGISVKSVHNHSRGLTTNLENRKKLGKKPPSTALTNPNKISKIKEEKIKEMIKKDVPRKKIADVLCVGLDTIYKHGKEEIEELRKKQIISKLINKDFEINKSIIQDKDLIIKRYLNNRLSDEEFKQEVIKLQEQINSVKRHRQIQLEQKERKDFARSILTTWKQNNNVQENDLEEVNNLIINYVVNNIENFEDKLNSLLKKIEEKIKLREKLAREKQEQENIVKIEQEILKGKNIQAISDKYNKPIKYITELAEPLYKKEQISSQQRNMIIKYGIYLKVPVDYLAEYVPCSQYMCEKVLAEYQS